MMLARTLRPAVTALLCVASLLASAVRAQNAAPHAFEGLHAGESARPAAPLTRDAEDEFAHLRFLDAGSARPLDNVRVEAWTEPGNGPLFVQTLVDEARSAEDGSVRVHWRRGSIHGEKLRISRSGYESQQISPDDDEVLLMPAASLRGRVLDLAGRPVAGATLRSRQSCAHAISASETHSAADGSFVLEDFPVAGVPELEVLADGYSARGELDTLLLRQQDLDARARGEFGCTIVLARCTPWRLRLLDAEGKPLAQRRVWTTDRPVLAQWTDAEGLCSFTPPTGASELTLETCDARPKLRFLVPMPPREGTTTLRPLDLQSPIERAGRATGLVRVDARSVRFVAAEALPRLTVFTHDGFVVEAGSSGACEVPLGPARAVVLGEFEEWLAEFAIDVRPEPQTLTLAPLSQSVIRVPRSELAARDVLLTQFGSRTESAELGGTGAADLPPGDAESILFALSPGAEHGLALEGADGSLRLAHFAPDPQHAGDLRATFAEPGCRLVPALDSASRIVVPWRGQGANASAGAQRGTVWPVRLPCPELDGERELGLPEGRLYYAEFAADGAVPRAVLRRARSDEGERIDLVRRARLEISGDAKRVFSATGEGDREGARFVLEPAPGPLFVHVEHADGSWSQLSLVLQPGEQRALMAR